MNGRVKSRLHDPWLVWTTLALSVALLFLVPAKAEMAMTKVIGVKDSAVELAAGVKDGLGMGARVTLLREDEPIIHPLSGEVLGVPQGGS